MSARIDTLLAYPTLITYGLRWWDKTGAYLGDISDRLVVDGSKVSRNSRAVIPGTFVGRLHWVGPDGYPADIDLLTRTLLEPYAEMTNPLTGERFVWRLGVYLAEAPRRVVQAVSDVEVQGYDIISAYNTPLSYSYQIDTNTPLSSAAEQILTASELISSLRVEYLLSTFPQIAAPRNHLWSLLEDHTYLDVLDSMMEMGGYIGVFSTRQGAVVSRVISVLSQQSSLVTLRTDAAPHREESEIIMPVGVESYLDNDQLDVPNYWLGVSDHLEQDAAPVEGAGIYELEYTHGGPTSVEHRGRRVVSKVTVDSVNQNSLIAAVERRAELDTAAASEAVLMLQPFPEFWHEDVVQIDIPELGIIDTGANRAKMFATAWELPMDGSKMKLTCHRLRDVT